MASNLDMDNGIGFAKPLVLGAIALAFGIGAYSLIKSGDDTPDPKPAAATQAAADTAPATQAAVPADPAVAASTPPPLTAGMMPATTADPATAPVDTAAAPAAAQPVATAEPAAAPGETAAAPAAMPSAEPAPQPAVPAAQPAVAAAAPMPEPATPDPSQAEPATPAASDAASDIVMEDGAPTGTAATDPAAEPQEAAVETAAADDAPVAPVRAPAPPAVDALRPWWSASADDPFGVKYVGQAQDQAALVILFSQQVASPDTLADRIKVLGSDGQPVAGNWQQGPNPAVLIRPDLEPGRYTVVIDQAVASASGQTLQTPLHGPVHIQ